MDKFFKTLIGSWTAIFIKAVTAQIILMISQGNDIYSINYKAVLGAGILALIGVVYNYFNKDYISYGFTPNPDTKGNPKTK
jgi:hypothetical protein